MTLPRRQRKSHTRIFLLRPELEMRDLKYRLGGLCFLMLDMLKDTRDADGGKRREQLRGRIRKSRNARRVKEHWKEVDWHSRTSPAAQLLVLVCLGASGPNMAALAVSTATADGGCTCRGPAPPLSAQHRAVLYMRASKARRLVGTPLGSNWRRGGQIAA